MRKLTKKVTKRPLPKIIPAVAVKLERGPVQITLGPNPCTPFSSDELYFLGKFLRV